MSAHTFPCVGCGAPLPVATTEPVRISTEHVDAVLTADVFLCAQCQVDASDDPVRSAEIIRRVLDLPVKTRDQLARENAEYQCNELYDALCAVTTIEAAAEAMAGYLTLVFGDGNEAAAEVVARQYVIRILHGIEVEHVGALSGKSDFLRGSAN